MFNIYEKTIGENQVNFKKSDRVSIAGNRRGIVVQYLRTILEPTQTEPFKWHIPIESLCTRLKLNGNSLIINVYPAENDLLLEVLNIWGHSHSGWTPILLECKDVLDGLKPCDVSNFLVGSSIYEGPSVFTMLYLKGSVEDGKITEGINKSWNFPKPGPTNSVLLWPATLEYFASKMGYVKART